MTPLPRVRSAWIIAAHTLAAAAFGGLEAVRLGAPVARTTVPVFALTGLVIGGVLAIAAVLAARTTGWRAALVGAAPSLAVTLPAAWAVAGSGALAGLPAAALWPWLVAGALWPATAAMLALGRALVGDRLGQSIAIVALAGMLGGIVWLERQPLGAALVVAHVATTLALLALVGVALRVAYRGGCAGWLAAVIAALALGTGIAALGYGLRTVPERQRLAVFGGHGRELVWLWRKVLAVPRFDCCEDAAHGCGGAAGEPR